MTYHCDNLHNGRQSEFCKVIALHAMSQYSAVHRFSMPRRRQQRISKAFIRQHLEASDAEDNAKVDHTESSNTAELDRVTFLPACSSTGDLSDCRSWLQQRCKLEQVRLDEIVTDHGHREVEFKYQDVIHKKGKGENRRDSHHALGDDHASIDTAVLQRIREGRGPRDHVFEDLLAAFRDAPLQSNSAESYDEMKRTLLTWNKKVSGDCQEGEDARELLKIAIERRAHLLKAPARGSDKSQFLEESSTELLKALAALRPEIASFKNQDFFDIMVMMWANARIAIPDLDDELRLLTMKALINELESKSHASNSVKLSGIARSLSVARLQLDSAQVKHLEKKMQAFKNKLREAVVKKVIDKIKVGRGKLAGIKLLELQELTELQAAQKWAAYDRLGDDKCWRSHEGVYALANVKLEHILQHQGPDLDARVNAIQSNANALAGISGTLVSRAEKAGFSLDDQTSPALADLGNVDVEAYVIKGVTNILNAREQAAKMLGQMETVESHLEVMLDAAKGQYRAYDEVLRTAERTESEYNKEVQLVEDFGFGPRRESILLMCRDMHRAKQAS